MSRSADPGTESDRPNAVEDPYPDENPRCGGQRANYAEHLAENGTLLAQNYSEAVGHTPTAIGYERECDAQCEQFALGAPQKHRDGSSSYAEGDVGHETQERRGPRALNEELAERRIRA